MRVELTQKRVTDFACPPGKAQAFLRDLRTRGFAVRVTSQWQRKTNERAKSYIFECKLSGKTLRLTIGECQHWNLEAAREEAERLSAIIRKQGKDPRQLAAEQQAAEEAAVRAKAEAEEQERKARAEQEERERAEVWRATVPARVAWEHFLQSKTKWSAKNLAFHIAMGSPGGLPKKNRQGTTARGPLAPLLDMPLASLTQEYITAWVAEEKETRPTYTALAFRVLLSFIRWVEKDKRYKGLTSSASLSAEDLDVPKVGARDDCLQKEQLAVWFSAVQQLPNKVHSVYLQGLLLTGARRRELSHLEWSDVDFQWKTLHIRDKVKGRRKIPLTPYFEHLLSTLPRTSRWVFPAHGTREDIPIQEPRFSHAKALEAAGIPHLSLHGLRRSFGALPEWQNLPVGVVAQIMGHSPSALAEKHYRPRQLDLLRKWHTEIESWILKEAGILFTTGAQPLRLVSSHVSATQ